MRRDSPAICSSGRWKARRSFRRAAVLVRQVVPMTVDSTRASIAFREQQKISDRGIEINRDGGVKQYRLYSLSTATEQVCYIVQTDEHFAARDPSTLPWFDEGRSDGAMTSHPKMHRKKDASLHTVCRSFSMNNR